MSGISWPQADMPDIWQAIAYIFPSTFGIRGFLRISSMGGTLSDIQREVTALWIQTIAYFSLTCAVYRFQINHTRKHAYEKVRFSRIKLLKLEEKQKAEE